MLEPLELQTVWLVLAIVVVEQPITRAEITARRMAGSDRQVQVLLQQHRLVREEPHAALPGRRIPLITTDLLLRRLGTASIGELQHRTRFPMASGTSAAVQRTPRRRRTAAGPSMAMAEFGDQPRSGGVVRRLRVTFLAETVIEAADIRHLIRQVEALSATDITAIARQGR